MTDIIDPHYRAAKYARLKEQIAADPTLVPSNRDLFLRYLRESELGKTIRKGQKRKIGAARNARVCYYLLYMDQVFRKPLEEVTTRDMENFILALEGDELKCRKGTPFASESKLSMKCFIRKFWKWLKGDGRNYPDEVEWIDTSGKPPEITCIPGLQEGVAKLASYAPTALTKAIVWVLFDSGARLTEFLNIRIADVHQRDGAHDGVYFIRIRHATSKTQGRMVALPLASEPLGEWLRQHPDAGNPEAFVFPVSAPGMAMSLKRLGARVLGMNVHPHLFRHTSATYYASLLDRATYCKRFGWSFSSDMPDRYIDWAKIEEEKTVQAVRGAQANTMQEENRVLRDTIAQLRNEQAQSRANMERINAVMEALLDAPGVQEQIQRAAHRVQPLLREGG